MAEVRAVLKKMKRHKAPGLSGLVAEMIQATGDIGTQWILDAKTGVRTVYGNSKSSEVKVGMHQGSALSPLLFVIVMDWRLYLENLGLPCRGNCCMRMSWQ